jgi:hypothetical protein
VTITMGPLRGRKVIYLHRTRSVSELSACLERFNAFHTDAIEYPYCKIT